MNSEGKTNIADLKISDDMDTWAAASAKRPADSPSRIIDEVDPKKNKDSAATVMTQSPMQPTGTSLPLRKIPCGQKRPRRSRRV